MRGLLDTHTFLWAESDPKQLSKQAALFLRNLNNDVLLSVVSVWEIMIKVQIGKLELPLPLPEIVGQQDENVIKILPVSAAHVLALEHLPAVHKDPFDRLLIAQANVEGAVLITADAVFAKYPVNVLW